MSPTWVVYSVILLLLTQSLSFAMTIDERLDALNATLIAMSERVVQPGSVVLFPYSTAAKCPSGYIDLFPNTGNEPRSIRLGAPPPSNVTNTVTLDFDCQGVVTVNTNGFEQVCRGGQQHATLTTTKLRQATELAYRSTLSYYRACIRL